MIRGLVLYRREFPLSWVVQEEDWEFPKGVGVGEAVRPHDLIETGYTSSMMLMDLAYNKKHPSYPPPDPVSLAFSGPVEAMKAWWAVSVAPLLLSWAEAKSERGSVQWKVDNLKRWAARPPEMVYHTCLNQCPKCGLAMKCPLCADKKIAKGQAAIVQCGCGFKIGYAYADHLFFVPAEVIEKDMDLSDI